MRKAYLFLFLLISNTAFCQAVDSLNRQLQLIQTQYSAKADHELSKNEKKLVSNTARYLERFIKEEEKLQSKLSKIDSNKANKIFNAYKSKYQELKNKLYDPLHAAKRLNGSHVPLLDSIKSSIQFLQSMTNTAQLSPELLMTLNRINSLQNKLRVTEEIRKFVKSRQEILLKEFNNAGLIKSIRNFQKEFAYYQSTFQDIKESLNNPEKLSYKALEIIRRIPSFQDYFSRHSELAGLFHIPGSGSSINSEMLKSLQTREAVQNLLNERIGTAGTSINQTVDPLIQNGQTILTEIMNKSNGSFGNISNVAMPEMPLESRENNTKSKKLEKGFNIQNVRPNGFFPATSDLTISIGYRVSEKFIVGIGTAYKLGWGENIRKIKLSHQGIGIRTYFTYQLKGTFFMAGGIELNYRNQIRDFEQLNEYSAWQKSILLGISKKYEISKKMTGNIQLLFDFLAHKQIPKNQLLLVRFGYNLR